MSLAILLALAITTDQTFDSNGVKIAYYTAGQGEPIVLIHGWMSDATTWGRELKAPEGFKVIAIDVRGHGKSDKPHDANKYGPEMAADVVRLLDHLKLKRAHLVGYSMGAFIVGKVAATHPDRVISAIYGGQAPLFVGADNSSSEVNTFAKTVEEGKSLASYIIEVTPPGRPKPTEAQAEAYAKFMFAGKDLKALAFAGRSFPSLAITPEALAKCKAPSLFIHGSLELESTKKRAAEWQKLLAKSEIKVVDGGDHITTLAKPAFGASLVEFIQKNKSH